MRNSAEGLCHLDLLLVFDGYGCYFESLARFLIRVPFVFSAQLPQIP